MNKLSPNATRYTAIGLVVFGLLFIFFAWNGAAGPENGLDQRAQFPYLISGGIGGLALVAAGLTLVRIFEARRDTQQIVEQLKTLTAAVEAQTLAATPPEPVTEELPNPAAFPPPASPPPFEPAQ